MNADPYGYGELLSVLKRIQAELLETSDKETAEIVARAAKFVVGSPSEFLGESRLALEAVLGRPTKISEMTKALAKRTIEKIDEGFRSVGGG